MKSITKAQLSMLRMLSRWEGDGGSGFWEYVNARDGALAVRNADRVVSALQQRGLVTPAGEDLEITQAGRAALAQLKP